MLMETRSADSLASPHERQDSKQPVAQSREEEGEERGQRVETTELRLAWRVEYTARHFLLTAFMQVSKKEILLVFLPQRQQYTSKINQYLSLWLCHV